MGWQIGYPRTRRTFNMVVRKGIELVTKKCDSHDYILGGTQQLSWKGHPLDPFVENVIDL